MVAESIGKRIEAARLLRRMTQAELGRRVGLGQPTISRIESGRRAPSIEQVYRLARALRHDVSDLLPNGRAA